MATTTIQIKRSPNVTAATTTDLLEGELAYSYDKSNDGAGAKLYIEVQDNAGNPYIHTIGGKYYTSLLDNATSSSAVSTIVSRDALGNFSAGNISARLFGTANSAITANTADSATIANTANSATIANTANTLTTARTITLGGDLSGNVSFNGSQDVTLTATITNSGPVHLGTDTTGNYVGNVTAGNGIIVSGTTGENWTPNITLSATGVTANTYGSTTVVPVITIDTYGRITSAANATIAHGFNIYGNSGVIAVATDGSGSIELTGGAGITSNASGTKVNFDLRTSGVSASTYGGTTNIPVFTVDTYGRVTSASNVAVSTAFTLAGNSGTPDTLSGGDTLRITGDTGINTVVSDNTISIFNTGVTSLTGTANEIEVSSSNAAITIGLPNDVTIGNNLTVTGDLFVLGNATTLNTATLAVEDPLVKFGNANPSDILDIGFFGEYTSAGTKYAGLFRDASDSGKFKLFKDLTTDPTSNVVDTSSYTIATLVSNLTGGTVSGLTANIAVGDGGTGRGTFTTNGVLLGNTTGALKVTAAGTAGQVLQVGDDGVPVFTTIDGGTY